MVKKYSFLKPQSDFLDIMYFLQNGCTVSRLVETYWNFLSKVSLDYNS
jgi:hypothetical protein